MAGAFVAGYLDFWGVVGDDWVAGVAGDAVG